MGLILIRYIIFFFSWGLLTSTIVPLQNMLKRITKEKSYYLRLIYECLPLVSIIVITILFTHFEKYNFHIIEAKKIIYNLGISLLWSIIWVGGVLLVIKISKLFTLIYKGTIANISIWLLSIFLNSICQELLFRGYLFQLVKYKYNDIWAIIVTSIIFAIFHIGTFHKNFWGIVNSFTAGIIFGLLLYRYNSLFMVILVHFIWNSVLGLGLGIITLPSDYPSFFDTTSHNIGIFWGKDKNKFEGSIFIGLVNIFLIFIMLYFFV